MIIVTIAAIIVSLCILGCSAFLILCYAAEEREFHETNKMYIARLHQMRDDIADGYYDDLE